MFDPCMHDAAQDLRRSPDDSSFPRKFRRHTACSVIARSSWISWQRRRRRKARTTTGERERRPPEPRTEPWNWTRTENWEGRRV